MKQTTNTPQGDGLENPDVQSAVPKKGRDPGAVLVETRDDIQDAVDRSDVMPLGNYLREKYPEKFEERKIEGGETFIQAGEKQRFVYVVGEGSAEVKTPTKDIVVGTGHVLGDVSAFTAAEAIATVTAASNMTVYCLPQAEFRKMLEGDRVLKEKVEKLSLQYAVDAFKQEVPESSRKLIRHIRDQNIDGGLFQQEALTLVNKADGIFAILNPEGETYRSAEKKEGVDVIDQKYELIDSVVSMLRSGATDKDILEGARGVRGRTAKGKNSVGTAMKLFREYAAKRVSVDQYVKVKPATMSPSDFTKLVDRLRRIAYIEHKLAQIDIIPKEKANRTIEARLEEVCSLPVTSPGHDPQKEAVEEQFADIFTLYKESNRRDKIISDLRSIDSGEVESGLKAFNDATALEEQTLKKSSVTWKAVAQTAKAIEAGDGSAVGGIDYVNKRLPPLVRAGLKRGEIAPVVYNGDEQEGIRYIRNKYGRDEKTGFIQQCLVNKLNSIVAIGPRTLLTFADGRKFLLLCGRGEARQRTNACMLLFSEDENDTTDAPKVASTMDLASQGIDYAAQIRSDFMKWHAGENGKAIAFDDGTKIEDANALRTQILIAGAPRQLEAVFGKEHVKFEEVSGMFPFTVAYVKQPDGTQLRVIIGRVGGPSLFGDTAENFVEGCYTSGIKNLSTNLIFTGTSAGFSNTQGQKGFEGKQALPKDVKPGGVLIPTGGVVEIIPGEKSRNHTIHSSFEDPEVMESMKEELNQPGVYVTTAPHGSIGSPTEETNGLINGLVEKEHICTLEMESGPIAKAFEKLKKNYGLTLTADRVWIYSDDARGVQHNPKDSLGMQGPFFAGSKPDPRLWNIIGKLMLLSDRRQRGGEERKKQ